VFERGALVLASPRGGYPRFFGIIDKIHKKTYHVAPWKRWNGGDTYLTYGCTSEEVLLAFWAFLGPICRDQNGLWWLEHSTKPTCLGSSTASAFPSTGPTFTTLVTA
jgi:hypothetical protein